MHEHVLVQMANERQREMRKAAGVEHGLRRSSQELAAEVRSLEHHRQRARAALALRQAE
jgi:hypothetical protein